jgi:WD40 repeat protein
MVCIWRADDGKLLTTLPGNDERSSPLALAFCNGSARLAAARPDELVVWDLQEGRQRTCAAGGQKQAAFSLDGRTAATANDDSLYVWDVATLRQASSHTLVDAPSAIALSPDGQVMALCLRDEEHARIDLRPTLGTGGQPLAQHAEYLVAAAFSGDGRVLACAGSDGKVYVYGVVESKLLCTIDCGQRVRSLSISPDGRTVACAAGRRVRLYSVPRAAHLTSIDAHAKPVAVVVFGADAPWLASGGEDGTVRIWRPAIAAGGAP